MPLGPTLVGLCPKALQFCPQRVSPVAPYSERGPLQSWASSLSTRLQMAPAQAGSGPMLDQNQSYCPLGAWE